MNVSFLNIFLENIQSSNVYFSLELSTRFLLILQFFAIEFCFYFIYQHEFFVTFFYAFTFVIYDWFNIFNLTFQYNLYIFLKLIIEFPDTSSSVLLLISFRKYLKIFFAFDSQFPTSVKNMHTFLTEKAKFFFFFSFLRITVKNSIKLSW